MSDNPSSPFWKDSRFIIGAIFVPIVGAIISTGFWQNTPANTVLDSTPIPEKPSRIVYQRRIKDNPDPLADDYDLYIATLAENGVWSSALLIGGESSEIFASPSPDGEKIAFISDRAGNFDLWVINVDGTNLRQLTDISGDEKHLDWGFPTWTLDSRNVIFSRNDDGYKFFQIALNNAGVLGEPLFENGIAYAPMLSPKTGRWIVYSSKLSRDALNAIWIYDLSSKVNTQLTFPEGRNIGNCVSQQTENLTGDLFPVWSPDETFIVFQGERDLCKLMISQDGKAMGDPVRLTNSDRTDWAPAISPDGKWVAYYHSGIDSIQIIDIVNGDSAILGQIADLSTEGEDFLNSNPRWIP